MPKLRILISVSSVTETVREMRASAWSMVSRPTHTYAAWARSAVQDTP